MSILKVSCSVFLNWVCWTRGNLLASRVTYAFMCASPLCGVPGRYEHIWSLCWSGCRAGTRILGNPLIRLAGLYGLFRLLGIVLAWMCVIKQVEGGGGGRDSTIFFSFPGFFGGSGTIEMVGGAVFKFSLSSVCC